MVTRAGVEDMSVDFRDAAERHWTDAWFLFNKNRIANSDHLIGMAAECALKAVMLALGMRLRPDGRPEATEHSVHINELWDEFVTFSENRSGAHYAAPLLGVSNPFAEWNVNQRYDHHSSFLRERVERHQRAAETTMRILQKAIIEGVVP